MMNDNLLQTIQSELTPPRTHKKIYKNLICLCLEKTTLVQILHDHTEHHQSLIRSYLHKYIEAMVKQE
jgi:hypothetical protein